MNSSSRPLRYLGLLLTGMFLSIMVAGTASGQNFNFERLDEKIRSFSVLIDLKYEISFGIHTSEQQDRYLGTIVTDDGLVLFNGTALNSEATFSSPGFTVKTTPIRIEITTLDGDSFAGEFVGVDQYTNLGFIRILDPGDRQFTAVEFSTENNLKVGDWVGLYMLLPEYIDPPLAADVGMISSLVRSPEEFALTVGFSSLQLTSVLFDERLRPVGVLGTLLDRSSGEGGGLLDSFGGFGLPLLGVISGERINRIVADPPTKGEIERGWLGITLQALTPDISEYFGLGLTGGIIVNNIIKGSPADQAGLLVKDIIWELNGRQITVDRDENLAIFQRNISELGPQAAVELSVLRRSETGMDTVRVLATLERAPIAATDALEYENETLEFKVRNLVFADYMRFNLEEEDLKGVVVSELQSGGLANVGGLRLGDVIQRIDDYPVISVDDARASLDQIGLQRPSEVIFFVWRASRTMFINIKTNWD